MCIALVVRSFVSNNDDSLIDAITCLLFILTHTRCRQHAWRERWMRREDASTCYSTYHKGSDSWSNCMTSFGYTFDLTHFKVGNTKVKILECQRRLPFGVCSEKTSTMVFFLPCLSLVQRGRANITWCGKEQWHLGGHWECKRTAKKSPHDHDRFVMDRWNNKNMFFVQPFTLSLGCIAIPSSESRWRNNKQQATMAR